MLRFDKAAYLSPLLKLIFKFKYLSLHVKLSPINLLLKSFVFFNSISASVF